MRSLFLACLLAAVAGASEAKAALSLDEAQILIREFIVRTHPDVTTLGTVQFLELTPSDVLNNMHVQVFKIGDGPKADDAVLIENGTVSDFCTGLGGFGLQSMCLCDLDGDGKTELAYTFSWGSGIHRTQIGLFSKDSEPQHALLDWSYCGDLFVKKGEDGSVAVESGNYGSALNSWSNAAPFGRLRMKKEDGKTVLEVDLSDSVSDADKKKIWKGTHE